MNHGAETLIIITKGGNTMKRKILITITALTLCLSLLSPVFAANDGAFSGVDAVTERFKAENLKELGLFQGVGTNADGSTNFDLERAPSRLEALVMLVRLLGKDAEAKACTEACPFEDVPAWGQPYVAYAYNNGLTKGSSSTQFGMGDATASQYLTFVLRALGYDDTAGDFAWDDNTNISQAVGILPEGINTANFRRADVVSISYAAMVAKLKNSDTALSDKLISAGVFTQEQFETVMSRPVYDENNFQISLDDVLANDTLPAELGTVQYYVDRGTGELETPVDLFVDFDGAGTNITVTKSDTGGEHARPKYSYTVTTGKIVVVVTPATRKQATLSLDQEGGRKEIGTYTEKTMYTLNKGEYLCIRFSEIGSGQPKGNQFRLNCGQGEETFSVDETRKNLVYCQGGTVIVTYGSQNAAPELMLEKGNQQTFLFDIGRERTVTITFYPDPGKNPEALIFVNGKNTIQKLVNNTYTYTFPEGEGEQEISIEVNFWSNN